MKTVRLITVFLAVCFNLTVSAYAADQETPDAGYEAHKAKLDERYRQAITLKDDGDYDAALAILQTLIDENQGSVKYEIARLDTILEQSREMKEAKNAAWKSKARETSYRIKAMAKANADNGDYWLIYAKYSWLTEAREVHITKALQKAFYFKPNNPEAYIVRADYHFDKAREVRSDGQFDMMHGVGPNSSSDKLALGQIAKSSYEAALLGQLSDSRKAYIYYKMGNLEDQIFHEKDLSKKDWEAAVKLAPDSSIGKMAKQRLGS
ncbi:MAG: hypothetical protein ACLPX5_16440 [Dissulfurispiraceae bacterium]